jgi:hypothetical protein
MSSGPLGAAGNPLLAVASYGIGRAISPILVPGITDLENYAWSTHRIRPLSVEASAALWVEGVWEKERADTEASYTGFSTSRLEAIQQLLNDPPAVELLYQLWRRNQIDPDKFNEALKHLRVEEDYWKGLRALRDIRLSAEAVANAVQQGHMPNDGILPQIDPTIIVPTGYHAGPAPDDAGPSHVPLTQIAVDPTTEAAAHGVDVDRLKILANLVGLPPGPEALLTMWNRSLIDEESVDAGIREGHMKTKWAHAYKRMRWAVLTAPEYAELRLRDWISEDEMNKGGALTGHTPEQMLNLYRNRGRTATPRQVWLAWARGKTGPRGVPADFIDHEQAIRRSNIRPEYAEMLWEIRFNYPPLFQLGRLVTVGAIDPATAALWAKYQLYGPDVVDALTLYWESVYPGPVGGTTGKPKAQPRVKSAQTTAITEIRSAFLIGQADETAARGWLGRIGVEQDEIDGMLPIWQVMLEVPQKGLSAAQIKKAYQNLPSQWPRDRAISELDLLGYTADDAATILDE